MPCQPQIFVKFQLRHWENKIKYWPHGDAITVAHIFLFFTIPFTFLIVLTYSWRSFIKMNTVVKASAQVLINILNYYRNNWRCSSSVTWPNISQPMFMLPSSAKPRTVVCRYCCCCCCCFITAAAGDCGGGSGVCIWLCLVWFIRAPLMYGQRMYCRKRDSLMFLTVTNFWNIIPLNT